MTDGWIKLHRKLLNHEDLDNNTFSIFCWLLLMADRNTGKVKHGRFQIAQRLKIHPSSVYRALKRLESMKMIVMKSNNKRTTSEIVNWFTYQSNRSIEESVQMTNRTTIEQQTNTKQEIRSKNKEYIERETTSLAYLKNIPLEDIRDFLITTSATENQIREKGLSLVDYCESHGKKYKNYKALLRNSLRKDYPKKEKIELLSNLI